MHRRCRAFCFLRKSRMARYKKKDYLAVAGMLEQVNNRLVGQNLYSGDLSAVLSDCQEAAIILGTNLEQQGEEGVRLTHILEDYCESLYQLGEKLAAGAASEECMADIQTIACQLAELQEGIKEKLPERKEVVFLPYKASMWDSLESVWMAADKDPDCDAYVIPIPYYDKKPDGSLGEFHYEGDLYPDYVPITDYREYDLEEWHPDMIYVHNPYDEFNTVTSVAPEFYLKKIKDYTDKLVYIPYFVLGEIEPDDQEAIDGISHFCFLPGTWYADQVIVQSENMRQIYINEIMKAAEERNLTIDRATLEKKILGLGSPKFDKVANTKKEDVKVPQEWLSVIQKPDGSWKKIVFYNTSVTAFLENSELMIEKIRDVLGVFREHQDEIALLWRPHPLMVSTIESMRPDLLNDYQRIVKEYQTDEWGIYDDTIDLDRAITISDAYYGDWSSVVQLCKERSMPIMIQNPQIRY